jgi:NADH:ubiquinone oxidoreductase subunit 5 (subunit L)/multisubunit Na+/H+ antiporter MnhA subunit
VVFLNQLKVKYIVDVLMGISFLITAITGLIIFIFLPGGVPRSGYQSFFGIIKNIWAEWHNYVGILMILLVLVHLILNLNWIICMTKSFFKKKEKPVCNKPLIKKKK